MKYNRINHFLPTYHRVDNGKLPRYLRSCINLMGRAENNCITFLVNVNDRESIDYISHLTIPVQWQILYTNNINEPYLGKMYNQIYEQTRFKDGGTIVSMVADDMEWRTSGFDLAILDMINKIKGIGIVYCNDDYIQGKKLCVNLFTTRKYIEATRHPFMCEKFQSYFIDTVHMRIASKIKKAYYLKDVILKHHHYSADPMKADITSQRLKKVQKSFGKGYKEVDVYVNQIVKNLNKIF